MTHKNKKIVIATGGTGGHILPAFSLAQHLNKKGFQIKFISDKRGLKYLKSDHNLNIITIFTATVFKKNLFKSLVSFFVIIFSILKSLKVLINEKPDLIFGMGGYSSFPVCAAAKALKIPFILYENNLHIGKANRYLVPYAKKIFVSYKELQGVPSRYEYKICEIGNIIRKEIIDFNNKSKTYEVDKKLSILVMGGSQAAKIFGERLPEIFKECVLSNIKLRIFQQCLPDQNKKLKSFYDNLKIENEVFNFTNNLLDYFSKTDLAVTRSGSSMLAELINAKIPFISIPLPSSAEDHQLKNAIYYEKNGYSYLVEERDVDSKLFKLLKMINNDSNNLRQILLKQSQYSDKSVYKNIDEQIQKILNEKN
tara:strand:- start:17323 stop:18423 length:1101 start_codon:yes stop_codon:yes gene_type:complete